MYDYIKGTISYIKSNAVVLDNNGIGYLIYVANPYVYEENKDYTIYIYQNINENENTLYGFSSIDEKDMFLKLISVKGLGPKVALPFFATGSINGIKDAIERENILYLKKFPKIGDKLAKQIILDLKGKLGTIITDTKEETDLIELEEVLLGLGYKDKEIKTIIPNINKELTIEDQVKEALKLLLR